MRKSMARVRCGACLQAVNIALRQLFTSCRPYSLFMSAFVLKCAGLGHAHLSAAQDLQQSRRPLPVQATPQALLQPWQWGATVSSGRPLVDQLLAYQITRETTFSESHSIEQFTAFICPARVTAFMSQARAFSPGFTHASPGVCGTSDLPAICMSALIGSSRCHLHRQDWHSQRRSGLKAQQSACFVTCAHS